MGKTFKEQNYGQFNGYRSQKSGKKAKFNKKIQTRSAEGDFETPYTEWNSSRQDSYDSYSRNK